MTTKTFDLNGEEAELILNHTERAELRPRTYATLLGVSEMDEDVGVEMTPRDILAVRDGLSEEKAIEDGSYGTAVELFGSFHDELIKLITLVEE